MGINIAAHTLYSLPSTISNPIFSNWASLKEFPSFSYTNQASFLTDLLSSSSLTPNKKQFFIYYLPCIFFLLYEYH